MLVDCSGDQSEQHFDLPLGDFDVMKPCWLAGSQEVKRKPGLKQCGHGSKSKSYPQ